jgi:hypothetical protein
MWQFMGLAESVINRVDDSNGSVGDVFQSACEDLGRSTRDPIRWVSQIRYLPHCRPTTMASSTAWWRPWPQPFGDTGDTGTTHLKSRLAQALADRLRKAGGRDLLRECRAPGSKTGADRRWAPRSAVVSWPPAGRPRHLPRWRMRGRTTAPDKLGITTTSTLPGMATAVGGRSLHRGTRCGWSGGAGPAALLGGIRGTPLIHSAARLPDEAAGFRRRPGRGTGHETCPWVQEFRRRSDFLRGWPDQARARLAGADACHGDRRQYLLPTYLLDPAAHLIEGKHPLAATLLRRAMIEDTLNGAKSSRYKHAARHLLGCLSLASSIQDFGTFETHETFASRLHAKHSRKAGFWAQVAELSGSQR